MNPIKNNLIKTIVNIISLMQEIQRTKYNKSAKRHRVTCMEKLFIFAKNIALLLQKHFGNTHPLHHPAV